MRFCFHLSLLGLRESGLEAHSASFPKIFPLLFSSIYPIYPCQAWGAALPGLFTPRPSLTTCCRQIVFLVLVHYCTFFCISQNIKCIKEQLNSATNKDSTTADRVDGWSTAREKFDPLCIMLLCVSKGQHTQSTKRGNKHHVSQSGNRQTCLMKLLFTEGFDLTLI